MRKQRKLKLTWPQVDEIRKLGEEGVKQIAIAEQFGVNDSVVCRIINGGAWKGKRYD